MDQDVSMIKKYRPLFILRLFSWVVAIFSVAFAVGALIVLDGLFLRSPFLLALLAAYEILLLGGIFRSLQVRIEISEAGILYDSGSYIINTAWNNIERIGKRVPGFNIPVEGLVLRTPSVNKRNLILSIFWSSAMGYYEVDYSRSIPLQGIWSWNWRKSELAEDLKRYVPHLF
jgi:hypothetical protein